MNAILPVKDPAIAALIHNFQIMAVREGNVAAHAIVAYLAEHQ